MQISGEDHKDGFDWLSQVYNCGIKWYVISSIGTY